jgi:hypothetical protein
MYRVKCQSSDGTDLYYLDFVLGKPIALKLEAKDQIKPMCEEYADEYISMLVGPEGMVLVKEEA